MNAKTARTLTVLFPRAWRARYGEEFTAFLGGEPTRLLSFVNIVACAACMHIRSFGKDTMTNAGRSSVLVIYACAAAVAAGLNFYWTVDDTPLGGAMRSHPGWSAAWDAVAAGSVLAFFAGVGAVLPMLGSMVRHALAKRRNDILGRLAFLPLAIVALVAWLGGSAFLTGGHWVPTPWDITGDWVAPSEWPSLGSRWFLGLVTLLLLGLVFVGGSLSLKQAIQLLETPDSAGPRWRWGRLSTVTFAASVSAMAFGTIAWMILANRHTPVDFHAHVGGFLNCTTLVSCAGSVILLVGSLAIASRAAFWAAATE